VGRERGPAVGQHRLLREAGEALGHLERPFEMAPIGHDLRDEAHRRRLGGLDDAPAQDQVQRAPQADDPRQALRPAVDERDAEAPLREAEARALGGDAQVTPQRELEAPGQAPAGDRGDRGLGGGQAREAQRPLRAVQPRAEAVQRLEVGARAERRVARAGEDEHAGVVVGLEGAEVLQQPLGGRAVHGVAPLGPVDGQDGGGADALQARGLAVRRHGSRRLATSRRARRRPGPPPSAPPCAGPCASPGAIARSS
jgi:hypothetical protein